MRRYLLLAGLFVAGFVTSSVTRNDKESSMKIIPEEKDSVITIIKPFNDKQHATDVEVIRLNVLYCVSSDSIEYEKVRDRLPADGQTWVVRIGDTLYYAD